MNMDIRDAFFNEVYKIAQEDKNVIFITADADAFSLREYKNKLPEQFINVGCAEQNMVSVASGLALSGKKVFIYAIIPFIALRCYEQIKVNICSMNLPVHVVGIGSGFSFENDGATHHGTVDISVIKTLPEISILNPSDACSSSCSARYVYNENRPSYTRIDKGIFEDFSLSDEDIKNGFSLHNKGKDILIISTGTMVHICESVIKRIYKDNADIDVGLIDVFRIKDIESDKIVKHINNYEKIYCIEENCICGGLGASLLEILNDNDVNKSIKRIAIPNEQTFVYGSREWIREYYGIDENSIYKRILGLC